MDTPTPDLRAHFGLSAVPFTRELPIDKRWRHDAADQLTADLREILDHRMSAALIAPAGTGKTVLIRALVDGLPRARFRVTYVKVTALSRRDMCREIACALGQEPAGQYATLVRRIQTWCTTCTENDGVRPVLILDEAHDLRPEVLAILRVLTNFEMDSKLVLSMLLVGQPPLSKLLQRDEMEAVSRRLARFGTLRTLSREEARRYAQHRLTICGARGELLDGSAHDALYECAQGNLRATDSIALRALQLACRQGAGAVDANHVAAARAEVCP